ncbi:MAG TPA: carbon storage regulator [Bryobacteraceae bacterium]|nr:carbon storage regulator [Bryobacteraceae bacterium]
MLVLRRKAGEAIAIGDGIEISVIEISPTRVKLGVMAPREVSVLRKETIAVAMENRKAAELVTGNANPGLKEIVRALGSLAPDGPGTSPKGFRRAADKN